jgi:multidrug efflux pump subunit AcrA (membrane-fusion protein)
MHCKLVVLTLFVTVSSALAQSSKEPAQLTNARARYERAIDGAKKSYAADLSALQRQLTQQGNLEAALLVKAELDRLQGVPQGTKAQVQEQATDYVVFQGHRYEVVATPAKRNRAESECRKRGGALACADSPEELVFLHDLMMRTVKSDFWIGSKVGNKDTQWMGVGKRLHPNPRSDDELPYICEWADRDSIKPNQPSDRTR